MYLQINFDFEKLFPDEHLNLYLMWDTFMEKVINLRKSTLKDPTAIEVLDIIQTSSGEMRCLC